VSGLVLAESIGAATKTPFYRHARIYWGHPRESAEPGHRVDARNKYGHDGLAKETTSVIEETKEDPLSGVREDQEEPWFDQSFADDDPS